MIYTAEFIDTVKGLGKAGTTADLEPSDALSRAIALGQVVVTHEREAEPEVSPDR